MSSEPTPSKPPRIALWVGSLAMLMSLSAFPFVAMVANDLKRTLERNHSDILLSGKALLFIGGILESYWLIPAAGILLFYWFWCSRSSRRLISFAAFYSLFLVAIMSFPLFTHANHTLLIQKRLSQSYMQR